MINNGWANPVTLGVASNLDATAVQKELTVLLTVSYEGLDALKVVDGVKGADIEVVDARAGQS